MTRQAWQLRAALCACILTGAGPSLASPRLPDTKPISPSFLLPGDYHNDEVPDHPGTGWLALAPNAGGWELRAAIVKSERIEDVVLDEPGQRTGIRIAANAQGALALLRLPYLKSGVRATASLKTDDEGAVLERGKALDFTFKDNPYRIETARGKVVLSQDKVRTRLADLEVNVEADEGSRVLWAGDLDDDGKLDLLMGYASKNGGGACLYLSSRAAPGALVKQVACHGGIGC